MADSTEYLREIQQSIKKIATTIVDEMLRRGVGGGGNGNSTTIISIAPTIKISTLAINNTEYFESFSNIKIIEIFCRNLIEIHYSFNIGDIAANKYRTVPAGVSQPINLPDRYSWSGNLYLAAIADNAIVEIETWQ